MDATWFCREVGRRVRAGRKAAGLTQRELASRAGVSERLVRSVENGEARGVSIERVLSILAELGIGLELTDEPERLQPAHDASYSALLRQAVESWRGGGGA